MQLPALEEVRLIRRYKRFLADVELASGEIRTVHCPNTGAMTGCAESGSAAWISTARNPRRKYPNTLELVATANGIVSVNTGRANALVRQAITANVLPTLAGFTDVAMEAPIPHGGGRFDLALSYPAHTAFVEVKSVTLYLADGLGAFPDAVSARALKHVVALSQQVAAGQRGVLVFCSQHCGIERVRPAHEIDPAYAAALGQAVDAGVEVVALACRTDGREFIADRQIEFLLS